jgi:hypothetical protein
VTVYEYYNVEEGTVQHYVKQADTVIFEDKIDYVPYSMFSLNQSGIDCTGLSEVQLVLNQQETVNDLLSHLKEIAYLQIPRILYDAGRITEEDLNKAVAATTGSFVGIRPENSEALRTLNTLFFPMPTPDTPASVVSFVDRQENDAAFISALAEAARGQVAGARTATEMAIIDAQMRTRLATREGHLNDAIEDVGRKAFYLMRKYMTGEKMVRRGHGLQDGLVQPRAEEPGCDGRVHHPDAAVLGAESERRLPHADRTGHCWPWIPVSDVEERRDA